MYPIAAILDSIILYRYSMILALAATAGICFFLACCCHLQIPVRNAAAVALTSVILSLLMSRLVYWYGRPDNYTSFLHALRGTSTESFALLGTFAGCLVAALVIGKSVSRQKILDCMSISGCFGIALGRLACFFSDTNRGQILTKLTSLPWAYPVTNVAGNLEYRFATFLFQAVFAAILGFILTIIFLRKKYRQGDITILFLLCYCASQIILDSTRYDSLYLRSNGFISMVQLLSGFVLATVLVLLCIRAVTAAGFRKWMILAWSSLPLLLGGTGYMEYYVQRHGREAFFSYSLMGICLIGIVACGILLWCTSRSKETE